MLVIGVVGGIASGKSHVARILVELGGTLLDADRMGHEVLLEDSVKHQVRAIWGDSVFSDQEVCRRSLAKVVFDPVNGEEALKKLENITHPLIGARLQQKLSEWKLGKSTVAAVLDAPILFKAKWDKYCDKILFVESELSVRQARAAERGWAEGELLNRESRQIALERKKQQATDIVDNSGPPERTLFQLKRNLARVATTTA